MLTISALVKLALSLGFVVSFESIDSLDNAAKYYSEDTKTVYECTIMESDIGKISICQSGVNTAKIFVQTEKQK